MLKTLLLVLAGLAAGFAIASWLTPSAPSFEAAAPMEGAAPPARAAGSAADGSGARLAALESALAAEVEQRAVLEERVGELAVELTALRDAPRRAGGADGLPPGFDPAARGEQMRERLLRDATGENQQRRQIESLIAGGFSPDRAEWINRRTQELQMQILQAQYDATREGRPLDAGTQLAAVERSLRTDLGEADYERYLQALDRPTNVLVSQVLASSPGERSGLKPGDEVVAYNGKRVFDLRELNALTLEGTAGESVTIDVRRDGQQIQIVMPRGPVGITSSPLPSNLLRNLRGPPGR